jgi:hypothetical protein
LRILSIADCGLRKAFGREFVSQSAIRNPQ